MSYSEAFLSDLKARLPVSELVGRTVKLKKQGAELVGLSPFQQEKTPSFTVNDAKGFYHDFSSGKHGDVFSFLMETTGMDFHAAVAECAQIAGMALPNGDNRERPPRGASGSRTGVTTKRELVARYDYRDSLGELLYEVCRYEWTENGERQKTFLQRRPDGAGHWIWGLSAGEFILGRDGDWYQATKDRVQKWIGAERKHFPDGVEHALFRLPELREAGADEIVYLPEGEKDVETLRGMGLVATTNSGGSRNWRADHAEASRGRDVVILLDNDEPGRERGKTIAASLHGVARRVRVLDFSHPDIWPMAPEHADVSDWVRFREGDAAELAEIVGRLPDAEPAIAPVEESDKSKREMPRAWWRDPATIPARSSLYDGHYIRRTIGATIGGGGRAKTTRGIYEGVSMAVGFDIATKDKLPAGALRVWICNGEEDQDELDRRVAAACQRYNISQADLGGRLFVQSVRDNPLRIATLVNNRPVIDEAIKKYMADFIERDHIDVFMLDPLVSFHGVLENDNNHMDVVVKEGFGAIANQTNSAGELFHHPGKQRPGQAETTVEDSRGASAVIWAVRSARVFNFMTPEEAVKLGLSEDERRLHVRITNGKANMGPLGKAKWLKLVVEILVNGDAVAVASPFSPPDPFKNVTTADMELARKLAATGEYRADMRSPKWIGYALATHFDLKVVHKGNNDPKDLERLKTIIKTWLSNKVLKIDERKDDEGKTREYMAQGSFKFETPAYSDDE